MKVVETHQIKKTHKFYDECARVCRLAKNLYNTANYRVRQHFIENSKKEKNGEKVEKKYLNYYDMYALLKSEKNEAYYNMPSASSRNAVLMLLDKNWKSFFKAIKDWKKNPHKYLGRPKLPGYKKEFSVFVTGSKMDAFNKTPYTEHGLIKLARINIEFPATNRYKFEQLQTVRIVPSIYGFKIEIIYNVEMNDYGLNKSNIMGVDIGVGNLATCVSSNGVSFIINGNPLKSINHYYNKKIAKMKSDLMLRHKQHMSNSIRKLTHKRFNKIKDYMHKATTHIIEECIRNDIGKIVVGKNKNWKQNVNLGKKNNQTFVQLPFNMFIQMLEYKCQIHGIDFKTVEESYTSKCSFIDTEDIKKQEIYLGKRIKRGLFKSHRGHVYNADINGAYNIIRKDVPDFNLNLLPNGIANVLKYPSKISF